MHCWCSASARISKYQHKIREAMENVCTDTYCQQTPQFCLDFGSHLDSSMVMLCKYILWKHGSSPPVVFNWV